MPGIAARICLFIAGSVLSSIRAAPAQATLFEHIYSGTVTYGYDTTDLFKSGTNLAGLNYTATYLIDDQTGISSGFDNTFAGSSQTYGGPSYNTPYAPVSAKLEIGGTNFSIIPTEYGSISLYNYKIDVGNDVTSATVSGPDFMKNHSSYLPYQTLYSSDYRLPFNINVKAGGDGNGSLRVNLPDGKSSYFYFTVASISSNPVAAVPEPASWALMIGGFGIAGGGLRRRPRRIAITA